MVMAAQWDLYFRAPSEDAHNRGSSARKGQVFMET
jgi:hypothetical protein